MKTRRKTWIIIAVSMAMLICGTAFDSSAFERLTETIHSQYAVQAGDVLLVHNINGDVTIRSWQKQKIDVVAEKRQEHSSGKLEDVEIRVSPGNPMRIETVHLVDNPKVSVEYDIHVPEGMIVKEVQAANGDLTISGTQGDSRFETSNGDIVAQNISGHLDAKTENGDIDVRDIDGVIRLESDNGDIEIRRVAGISRVKTDNGDIEAEIVRNPEGDVQFVTSNGEIILYLAPDLNAELDVQTDNGEVEIEGLQIQPHVQTETTCVGTLGSGGNRISARSDNDDIEVYVLHEGG